MRTAIHNAIFEPSYIMQSTVELLTGIVSELLGRPDQVSLEAVENGNTVLFCLRVPAVHFSRVVGQHGQTAQSLRIIVRAAGLRHGLNFEFVLKRMAREKPLVSRVGLSTGPQSGRLRS